MLDKQYIMLKIENLNASIEGNKILTGINLCVNAGEVHAIMGPNGSGKSTLSSVIAGREEYEIENGSIDFNEMNIMKLSPEERSQNGIFLSFQYPTEIPGVSVSNFIKTLSPRSESEIEIVGIIKDES